MTESRPPYIVNGREVNGELSAREMLERMGVRTAYTELGWNLGELANLLSHVDALTAEGSRVIQRACAHYRRELRRVNDRAAQQKPTPAEVDAAESLAATCRTLAALAETIEAILRVRGRAP